jgi:hypothetical protein
MTEPEAPGVEIVTGPPAKKLYALSKRVAARKGSAVGLLAAVSDQLRQVHAIFNRAVMDNLGATQQEVSLLLAFTKRLERRARELAVQRVSGMQEVAAVLAMASRQLDEADHGGYKIVQVQRQAEIDRRTLDRLQASIKGRVQEAAAVLAELEQAVDPLPGLKLVSGRTRTKHAALRKQQARANAPLPPGVSRDQIISAGQDAATEASLASEIPSEEG